MGGDAGLEIGEDLSFERRDWWAQRIGWVVLLAILAVGVTGIFGSGPVSSATVRGQGDIDAEYRRFLRFGAPVSLSLAVRSVAADRDGLVRVWVDRRYMDAFDLESVTPEPDGMESDTDRVVLAFRPPEGARTLVIRVRARARDIGRLRGAAGVEGGASVSFDQVVYP